jgi:biopolymer transport protein ExbD
MGREVLMGMSGSDGQLSEINMVPLIDVMLVLLVIFIVTAPLLTHAIKVDLPQASAEVVQPHKPLELALRESGELFWNGEQIDATDLESRMHRAAQTLPLPDLLIRANRRTAYEKVAQAMALANRAGLVKISFVIQPVEP